ncbi:importin alpha, partial [Reticulomyxa filosa]
IIIIIIIINCYCYCYYHYQLVVNKKTKKGTNQQCEELLCDDLFNCLMFLLHNPINEYRRQGCWVLSNVLAGKDEHKTMALQRNKLLSTLITIAKHDILLVRKEAIIALANATCDASASNVQLLVNAGIFIFLFYSFLKKKKKKLFFFFFFPPPLPLVSAGVIETLISYLKEYNSNSLSLVNHIVVILEALIHICGTAEEISPNVYSNRIEQCDGLTVLEELQSNEQLPEESCHVIVSFIQHFFGEKHDPETDVAYHQIEGLTAESSFHSFDAPLRQDKTHSPFQF